MYFKVTTIIMETIIVIETSIPFGDNIVFVYEIIPKSSNTLIKGTSRAVVQSKSKQLEKL